MARRRRKNLDTTVLEISPARGTGFYTTLGDFCHDNKDLSASACQHAKRLKRGERFTVGTGSNAFTVTSHGTTTRDQRRQFGISASPRPQRKRHGREVVDWGMPMASDERASYFPERKPRYGGAAHPDPLVARVQHPRYKRDGKQLGYYTVDAEYAKRRAKRR